MAKEQVHVIDNIPRLLQRRNALCIIIAFGVIVRLPLVWYHAGVLWPDSLSYYHESVAILRNHNLETHAIFHTPVYPLFLAAFFTFGETWISGTAILIAQHLIGIAATVVSYLIAERVFGRGVALLSSLLLSAHSLLLYYECVLQTEVVFVFWLTLLVYVSLVARQRNTWRWYALNGFVLAIAVLTRPIAQLLIYVLAAFICLKTHKVKQALLYIGAFICGYYALILPWDYVNYRTYGFFAVSEGQGLNLYFRAIDIDQLSPPANSAYPQVRYYCKKYTRHPNPSYYLVARALDLQANLPQQAVDSQMFGFAMEAVRKHPVRFAWNTAIQAYQFFADAVNSTDACPLFPGPYYCNFRPRFGSMPADMVAFRLPRRIPVPPSPTILSDAVTPASVSPPIGAPMTDVTTAGAPPAEALPQAAPARAHGRMVIWQPGTLNIPMMLVAVLASAQFVEAFWANRKNLLGDELFPFALFLITFFYFSVVTAVFNRPQDRYRLPIDPLLIMLAVAELRSVLNFVISRAGHGRHRISLSQTPECVLRKGNDR